MAPITAKTAEGAGLCDGAVSVECGRMDILFYPNRAVRRGINARECLFHAPANIEVAAAGMDSVGELGQTRRDAFPISRSGLPLWGPAGATGPFCGQGSREFYLRETASWPRAFRALVFIR